MAKQVGPLLFSGTMGGITFYEAGGQHLAKKKNASPSKSRYKYHPSYSNVRRNASWFSQAQKLASKVYNTLPRSDKDQAGIWYPLRNKAQKLVKKELDSTQILAILKLELIKLREEVQRKNPRVNTPITTGYEPVLPQLPVNKESSQQSKTIPEKDTSEILLGRYYARTDTLSLQSELSAYNTVLRELVHSQNKTEEALLVSKRNGLKPTRKLRW